MIKLAIARPVGVLVGVLLIMLFGALSLSGLPIQLTPDVSVPTITVTTRWPGAAPSEVEREILLEQEEVLKSVSGLERMVSEASDAQGTVTMEFEVGMDLDEALVRVSNRLAQVPDYPDSARQPSLATADSAGPPLAVLIIRGLEGKDPRSSRTWVEDNVIPRFERIPGVAGVRFFGGQDSEVQVRFDPTALAARGVTVGELVLAVRRQLADVSGGDVELGKRRYVVRTEVAPDDPAALEDAVLRVQPDGSVLRVGDVAAVSVGLRKATRNVLANGQDAMAMLFDREAGSNVLEVTEAILAETDRVNAEQLAPRRLEVQ
ncbi:MAG: efflux RND transporter permease subunit, partial [Myxococcota bacterium]|nr:efflux RND transporter permease subunit [Myxococcota bacterium]